MKKYIILLLMAFYATINAQSADFEYDGISYSIINDNELEVVAVGNYYYVIHDIVIPEKVIFDKEYVVTSIGESALENQKFSSITIPSTITNIGDYAFLYSKGCTSISIPASVKTIGTYAFLSCKDLISIEVDPDNENYSSQDGVLFNKEMTSIITCPAGISGAYSIPETVTSLSYYAFYNCDKITSIDIHSGVTEIGLGAFGGCSNIQTLTLPKGITELRNDVFKNCTKLVDLYCLAEQVPNADYNTFKNLQMANMRLHVPLVALENYQTTTPWYSFGSILPIEDETGIANPTLSSNRGKSVKHLINGKIIFERDGKQYNSAGQELK